MEQETNSSKTHTDNTIPTGLKFESGALRKELGVIVYNFDKKEQVIIRLVLTSSLAYLYRSTAEFRRICLLDCPQLHVSSGVLVNYCLDSGSNL